jgi:hypothetical protein
MTDLVERLAAHRTLGSAQRAELEWIAAHGEPHSYKPGELVAWKARPAKDMVILLSGHIALHVDGTAFVLGARSVGGSRFAQTIGRA